MLTKKILENSVNVTETFVIKNPTAYLTAVEGSPLAEVNRNTQLITIDQYKEGVIPLENDPTANPLTNVYPVLVDSLIGFNNANKHDVATELNPHSIVMDELIRDISNKLREHISFAKNTVMPLVKEFSDSVSREISLLEPSKLLNLEINIYDLPKICSNDQFHILISDFENVTPPRTLAINQVNLPSITLEKIKEIILTGNKQLDDGIEELLAECGDSLLLDVWNNYFVDCNNSLLSAVLSADFLTLNEDSKLIEELAIIFLIANGLIDSPIEGVQVTLKDFNINFIDIRFCAGFKLCQINSKYEEYVISAELLVKSVDDDRITVYKPTYRTFLENGGTNEELFGLVLSKNYNRFLAGVIKNKETYRKEWEANYALLNSSENIRVYNASISIIKNEFNKLEVAQDPVIKELFDSLINKISKKDLECIDRLVLNLICNSIFNKTDAYKILSHADTLICDNPKMDVREATAISYVNYIVEWVFSQIKISA